MTRIILHVDLDAFFASVEQRDEPALRGQPVAVGATEGRGVVAAASYDARRYGVHSAMSMAEARRRCPDLVVRPPRFDAYREASREVLEIFEAVTPLVEPISLDEAFLDVSAALRKPRDIPELAQRIRHDIARMVGLTASVGVGPTKLIAKLASDAAKPDGVCIVPEPDVAAFLDPLPVERIWGIGPATSGKLHRMGVRTVAQLAALPVEALVGALGVSHGEHLAALARNDDPRPVVPERVTKSIGHETTLASDIADPEEAARTVRRLAEKVAARLRSAHLGARSVSLKVRFGDFRTITRSRTFAHSTDTTAEISAAAVTLLEGVTLGGGVRLLGVSVAQLAPTAVQDALPFAGTSVSAHDAVFDAVRARFGSEALRRASDLRGLPGPALEQDPAVRENDRTPSTGGS